jgi:hypothetical protein
MIKNQKDQKVQTNPVSNQSDQNKNNLKKEGAPSEKPNEKSVLQEEEKVKPVLAEDNKEQVALPHPHKTAVPVSTKSNDSSSL